MLVSKCLFWLHVWLLIALLCLKGVPLKMINVHFEIKTIHNQIFRQFQENFHALRMPAFTHWCCLLAISEKSSGVMHCTALRYILSNWKFSNHPNPSLETKKESWAHVRHHFRRIFVHWPPNDCICIHTWNTWLFWSEDMRVRSAGLRRYARNYEGLLTYTLCHSTINFWSCSNTFCIFQTQLRSYAEA